MDMSLAAPTLLILLSPSPEDWQAALLVIVAATAALLLLAFVAAWLGVRVAAIADRVVVYGVLAALLLTFYVGASLFFTSVIPVKTSYAYEAAAALMALFVAVTYAPASKLVQRMVDTALFRDYYDYEGTLQTFSQKLATALDQETLVQILLDGLMETLNLRGIAFVPLPEGLEPQVLQVIGPDDLRARGAFSTLEGRVGLLSQLSRYTLGSHLGLATQMVRRPFKGCAAMIYIGFGQQAGVTAILLLGHKAAGGPLRREDTALLLTIAHQAATALSNAQLVNGLRISLQQVQVSTVQLVAARTEQELLLHELVDADERQRASLARELHDDALQEVLFLIRHSQHAVRLADAFERSVEGSQVDLDRLRPPGDSQSHAAPTSTRLRRELQELAERSAVVEKKLRALCLGLYPDMLNRLGLTAALDDLAEQMNTSSLTYVTVEYDDEAAQMAESLDPQVALHLYRIAQESLSNAHKHGRASVATAHLSVLEAPTEVTRWHDRWSWIRLQIRDNGTGIPLPVDIGASLRDGHLGLASMRERAQLIGGHLQFDQAPEGGAQITVTAPIARILRTIPLSTVRP